MCDYIAELEEENETLMDENVEFYNKKHSLEYSLGFYQGKGLTTSSDILNTAQQFYDYLTA